MCLNILLKALHSDKPRGVSLSPHQRDIAHISSTNISKSINVHLVSHSALHYLHYLRQPSSGRRREVQTERQTDDCANCYFAAECVIVYSGSCYSPVPIVVGVSSSNRISML